MVVARPTTDCDASWSAVSSLVQVGLVRRPSSFSTIALGCRPWTATSISVPTVWPRVWMPSGGLSSPPEGPVAPRIARLFASISWESSWPVSCVRVASAVNSDSRTAITATSATTRSTS